MGSPRVTMMRTLAKAAFTTMLALGAGTAHAKSYVSGNTLVVVNDQGGYVARRAAEIRDLNARGGAVRLQGAFCMSSCTMYLGAKDVCIDPATIFLFHGPSQNGQRLDQQEFDWFSRIMAAHYPPDIKTWFMTTARYRIGRDGYRMTGHELIRHGVRPCR